MRYGAGPPHSSLAETSDWVIGRMAQPTDVGEDFAIEHEGLVIGTIGFFPFPEIGFVLRPDHWGRGLAGEAVEAVVRHGFTARGLVEIKANVDPRNSASLKLLRRLGFVETGREARTLQIGNEWCDSVYLSRYRPAIDTG